MAALTWQSFAIFRVSKSITTDSFVTLSLLTQIGLATVTIALVLILLMFNAVVTRKLQHRISNPVIALPVNLICAFCLFVVFWGVSPQVFYLYYQLLFDSLPWQWVIRDWFPLKQTVLLLFPSYIHNTSSLAAGIALVVQLAQVIFIYRFQPARLEQ